MDFFRFAIGFDHRDRARLHGLWDEVFESNQWSEGPMTSRFEETWSAWNGLESVALGGWTGGALTALEVAGVRGQTGLCPSNTFMATPLATVHSGARVELVDCTRDDLGMSFDDFALQAEEERLRAAGPVHH